MTARIRLWSSRNLSYSARSQLINSVLMSLHRYWAQVFILLKIILKEVNQICRAFLWSGNAFTAKTGAVSWEHLCWGKNFGGLGHGDVRVWSIACLGKYV